MDDLSDNAVERLSELLRLLVSDEGLNATLRRVSELACRTVPGCTMAGIALRNGDRFHTPVSTDPTVNEVDEVQYRANAGPCVDASRTNDVHRIADTSADERWPAFNEAAASAGIVSVLSLPMATDEGPVGALNLYSTAGEMVDEGAAKLFAQQAGLACLQADRYWRAIAAADQLQEALKTRDVIGQAKGIIMARLGLTADAAFDLLREASQHTNVKIRDLAERVSMTGEIPDQR